MFQKRSLWSIGVTPLALSLAACQQAEEPAARSGTTPAVSQPQHKESAFELRLPMLQHGVSWFDDREGKPLDFPGAVVL